MSMRGLQWIEDQAAALALSLVGAVLAAMAGLFLIIFVGAKLFRDEWSYGIPLAFGIPVALIAGIATFVIVFRKVRSL
jgi:hypothetical protein